MISLFNTSTFGKNSSPADISPYDKPLIGKTALPKSILREAVLVIQIDHGSGQMIKLKIDISK